MVGQLTRRLEPLISGALTGAASDAVTRLTINALSRLPPGEIVEMGAITHGPYQPWAPQDPSRPLLKGLALVFAEYVGQFYRLQEHESRAWLQEYVGWVSCLDPAHRGCFEERGGIKASVLFRWAVDNSELRMERI